MREKVIIKVIQLKGHHIYLSDIKGRFLEDFL